MIRDPRNVTSPRTAATESEVEGLGVRECYPRYGAIQPRPDSVLDRGRYSHPIQPS